MYIGVSMFLQAHFAEFQALFDKISPVQGMVLFIALATATVMIPFTSIIPVIPLAVALWGWWATALLCTLAWTLGGQILFEVSRLLGRTKMMKYLPPAQIETIHTLIRDKGLVHSILIRMVVHGDIISYAFGLFTKVNRWEFFLITALGVFPSAVLYALFGELPVKYQIVMAGVILFFLILYWIPDIRKHRKKAS